MVKDIYDGTASEVGRLERVSGKEVYRKLGLQQHRLNNMPKCKAIIEKYTESYPESWARKNYLGISEIERRKGRHYLLLV